MHGMIFRLWLLIVVASAARPWTWWQLVDRSEQCEAKDQGNRLVQTSITRWKASEKLLDKHIYLVGTNHKAGSNLLRNTMHWAFDLLGATDSCQYGLAADPITSKPGYKQECASHPTQIRFHNHISALPLLSLQKEAVFKGGLRGVMIVRDPFEIVASAYCYHHRGAEPGSSAAPANITEIEPEEGVPIMAASMLEVVRWMTSAYVVAKPDVLVVRFEKFTKSSKDFDNTVREILNFVFRNEITEKQKQQILNATAVEDVNRGLEGFSELPGAYLGYNHTNDEEDMAVARKALHLIPDDMLAEYQQHRKVLGYGA